MYNIRLHLYKKIKSIHFYSTKLHKWSVLNEILKGDRILQNESKKNNKNGNKFLFSSEGVVKSFSSDIVDDSFDNYFYLNNKAYYKTKQHLIDAYKIKYIIGRFLDIYYKTKLIEAHYKFLTVYCLYFYMAEYIVIIKKKAFFKKGNILEMIVYILIYNSYKYIVTDIYIYTFFISKYKVYYNICDNNVFYFFVYTLNINISVLFNVNFLYILDNAYKIFFFYSKCKCIEEANLFKSYFFLLNKKNDSKHRLIFNKYSFFINFHVFVDHIKISIVTNHKYLSNYFEKEYTNKIINRKKTSKLYYYKKRTYQSKNIIIKLKKK